MTLLMSKPFVDAASRSMSMQLGLMLHPTSKLCRYPRPYGLAFSILQTRSYRSKSSVSASVDVEPSSSSNNMDLKLTSANFLHTVVVHRNRQSAAFREGTPLVFGGSVSSTFTEYFHQNTNNINNDQQIPTGSLVAVVVGREPSSNAKPKKDSRGKKKSVDSSDRREDNAMQHHNFSVLEESSAYREMINQAQLIGYGVFNPESMYRVRIL